MKGTHLKGDTFLCFICYVADAISSPLLAFTRDAKRKNIYIKFLLVICTGEELVKDILGKLIFRVG